MKNKKKTLSIFAIVAIVVACMAITMGITLAYFGGNSSAEINTIKLKTGIEIGSTIESNVATSLVVPGQPVSIEAVGTVSATTKGTPNASEVVDGIVRAKFNIGNTLGDVTIAGAENGDVWVNGNDGYYYLTEANKTSLRTVAVGDEVKIYASLVVSVGFVNEDSGKTLSASVTFEIAQAELYNSDGSLADLTVANATTSGNPVYDAFTSVSSGASTPSNLHTVTFDNSFTTALGMYGYNGAMEGISIKFAGGDNKVVTGSEGSISGSGTSITFSNNIDGTSLDSIRGTLPEAVTNNYGSTTFIVKDSGGNVVWQDTITNGVGSAEDVTIDLTEATEFKLEVSVTKK